MENGMRTPDVPRSYDATPTISVKCENPGCDVYFEYRLGKEYHSDKCRSAQTANSRRALSRLDLPDGIETVGTPRSANGSFNLTPDRLLSMEDIWQELFAIDEQLFLDGPVDNGLVRALRKRTLALESRFARRSSVSLEEELQYARIMEILTDIGATSRGRLNDLMRYASTAVRIYHKQRRYPQLARVLLSLAMVYKLVKDEHRAAQVVRCAYHVIVDHGDPRSHEDLLILHQALLWEVRFRPDATLGQSQKVYAIDELVEMTDTIGEFGAKFQTARELIGYWAHLDSGRAVHEAANLLKLRSEATQMPRWGVANGLPQFIDCLLSTGRTSDKEQAVESIRGPYLEAYEGDKNINHYDHLLTWDRKYHLSITQTVEPPHYASPIRIFLPRKGDV